MQRSVELRKRAKENVHPDLARELDKYLQAMQHSQVCGDHMYVFGMAKCRVDYVCIYVLPLMYIDIISITGSYAGCYKT